MKTLYKPTKKEMQMMAEYTYKDTMLALQDETALDIIAVIRHFGLGEKRIRDFLKTLQEVKAEYRQNDKDEVFRTRLTEEIEAKGLKISELYEDVGTFKEQRRLTKQNEKKKLTIAEAKEFSEKLDAMKTFLNN